MPDWIDPMPQGVAAVPGLVHRIAAFAVGLVVVAVAGWLLTRRPDEAEQHQRTAGGDVSAPADTALPALPASPFLNLGPDAEYVGSGACRDCHADEFASWQRTGMGRSLARTTIESVPPESRFQHVDSGREYQIAHRDGELFHAEYLLAATQHPGESDDSANAVQTGDAEIGTRPGPRLLSEFPAVWTIGSGRHALSYLVEADGFLVESPVTWYRSRQAWGMSPGYDIPHQPGFQRAVTDGCLYCHAGRSAPTDGSLHRMQIDEAAISCERCHGPGSLHVARWSMTDRPGAASLGQGSGGAATDAFDPTIVNQRHLDTALSEDICSQCHLRSAATALARNRPLTSWRPGLPLSLFRTDYRLQQKSGEMTVVGHVEQLRESRCYQQSKLTCTTCHNPHRTLEKSEQVSFYRSQCLQCHERERCSVEPRELEQNSPDNNCVVCHMPTSDTDIPHLAFTHHRIGRHGDEATSDDAGPVIPEAGVLAPLTDLEPWSMPDRQRMLGLAYLDLAGNDKGARFSKEYSARARQLLQQAHSAGLDDTALLGALAALESRFPGDAVPFATEVLERSDATASDRINALLARAFRQADQNQWAEAADSVREVTRLRRMSADWTLLAEFEDRQGHVAAATECLEHALQIAPLDMELRAFLIERHTQSGNDERARWHREHLPAAPPRTDVSDAAPPAPVSPPGA